MSGVLIGSAGIRMQPWSIQKARPQVRIVFFAAAVGAAQRTVALPIVTCTRRTVGATTWGFVLPWTKITLYSLCFSPSCLLGSEHNKGDCPQLCFCEHQAVLLLTSSITHLTSANNPLTNLFSAFISQNRIQVSNQPSWTAQELLALGRLTGAWIETSVPCALSGRGVAPLHGRCAPLSIERLLALV